MKKILIIIFCVILTALSCISIFSYSTTENYFQQVPADLGTGYGPTNYQIAENILTKQYIKIIIPENNFSISLAAINDSETTSYLSYIILKVENNKMVFQYSEIHWNYMFIAIPQFEIDLESGAEYYIPVYCFNCSLYVNYIQNVQIYKSTTTDNEALLREYYNLGYDNGYDTGVSDGIIIGQDLQPELDLVGHVEQLMGTFVGQDNARYIVPIALVLIILFVYFLFIRWLLTLINSKNVTKVSDICVCAACLIILVVMYAPMLDLTIKNENITQVETTEAVIENNREEIHVSEYVKYHTETGDIWTLKGVDPPDFYSVESDVKVKEVKNEETSIS